MNKYEEIIGHKYRIEKRLGNGSFGSVFQGVNIRTGEKVAIKSETKNSDMKSLKNETRVYQYLNGCLGIPKIRWFGTDINNNYMVIDLLGYSLADVVKQRGKLSLHCVLKLGIQMIDILQGIHEKGMIHRDIKPDNFLLDPVKEFDQIYIIDFGLCKTYIQFDTNEHIEMKETKSFVGTPNFCSVNSHDLKDLSRRDDLESLGYMLVYFYFGSLPWIERNVNKEEIKEMKIMMCRENIEIPFILCDFLKSCQGLSFNEKPFYEDYKKMFANSMIL